MSVSQGLLSELRAFLSTKHGAAAAALAVLVSLAAARYFANNKLQSSNRRGNVVSSTTVLPACTLEERALGILLGTAVGDAKGCPYETMTREQIQSLPPSDAPFIDTAPHPYQPEAILAGLKAGHWSDDTQLTMAVIRALVASGGVFSDTMVQEHIVAYREGTGGWGDATRQSVMRLLDGTHPSQSGSPDATGNGVLMKMAPLVLALNALLIPRRGKDYAVATFTRMTHAHPAVVVSSLVHARALERLLSQRREAYDFEETRKQFLFEVQRDALALEAEYNVEANLSAKISQLLGAFPDLTTDLLHQLSDGGKGHHVSSLVLVYGLFAQRSPSFQSLLKAASFGGDTDTNAAILGAMIGLLKGAIWIPEHYLAALHRRNDLTELATRFAGMLQAFATKQ